MSYQPIVTVNISLDVAAVDRASFGTPIFIMDEPFFKTRTRTYTPSAFQSGDIAKEIPTDSDAYKALTSVFKQQVKPTIVKLGRRDNDTITFTPNAATAAGQTYTVEVNDTAGTTTTASFTTTTGSETASTIATAIVTALGSPAGVTVTDDTGSVTLAKSGTDAYAVTDVDRFTYTTVTTETAADMMAAITDEDDDFYFVAANDHSQAFILALSSDIEARVKQYWFSTQEAADLAVYSESATDTLSQLTQLGRLRTFPWFHHEADSIFPEMEYISLLSTSEPGRAIVAINPSQSGFSKNPTTGNKLSGTDKTNLVNKNASFSEVVGGITVTRRGTASGSATMFADIMRNGDFLTARVTENILNFMINTPVVIHTDAGYAKIRNVVSSTLDRYVSTDTQPSILQDKNPYVLNFPTRAEQSFSEVANRLYDAGFTAYLAGAIQIVAVLGSLTYEAES